MEFLNFLKIIIFINSCSLKRASHWSCGGMTSRIIFINLVRFLIVIVPVLVNVAFVTLFERKILGLSQSRKGPNKVSWSGLLQPFADAVKLFIKDRFSPFQANKTLFYLSPAGSLGVILLIWLTIPWYACEIDYSLIVLLLIMSLGLYPLLLAGWASNRAYALIGALRGVAQTISYEVSLALLLIAYFCRLGGVSVHLLGSACKGMGLFYIPIFIFLWLLIRLAETNRTPFDFAEGESELVSGFNIEYGGGPFAFIFIAEYGRILFLRRLTALIVGAAYPVFELIILVNLVVVFFWIWVRATLPRYRYDRLIRLAWKGLLPVTLSLLPLFVRLIN